MGRKQPLSTVLSTEEEALIVAFRKHTLLPLDDCQLYLFVAIDRTSKFAFAELHERMTRPIAVEFLRRLIVVVLYKIHTLLTDNGIQFANRESDRYAFPLLFDRICAKHGIEHRLTKPNHPWTNGQVERMNRTLKEATVYRCYYDTHEQLREHLATFLMAYNFAKRLKNTQWSDAL